MIAFFSIHLAKIFLYGANNYGSRILEYHDSCEHVFKAPIYNNLHLIERELSFDGVQQILS